MKNLKLKAVAMAAALAATLGACAPANATADQGLVPVNIGFPSAGGNWATGTLGVALEHGYLESYLEPLGFTPNVAPFVGAAPALHEALISGDLDIVNYAGFAGVLGRSNGIDTELLAITEYNALWSLVVAADSDIAQLSDLAGQRVAYTRGASPHMYLLRVLDEAGLEFDDIIDLNMTIPDAISALSTGSVDAAVVSNNQAYDLVEQGKARELHSAFDSNSEEFLEPVVSVGRSAFLDANPEVATAYLKALMSARDRIAADPNAYYELVADRSGNPLAAVIATAQSDKEAQFPLNMNANYLQKLDEFQQFQLANGLITDSFSIENWKNSVFVDTANDERA